MKTTLNNYNPKKEFLICIDSDGCAFDTMEIKHKECFCPATVDVLGLQAVSKYVRYAWEYTNLYSPTRGANRFLTLIDTLEMLEKREEVSAYHLKLPDYKILKNWVKTAKALNNQELRKAIENDQRLNIFLEWSLDCNERINKMVHSVPPFPNVLEALGNMYLFADIAIVSATAHEALEREWKEHDLLKYVSIVTGQEQGTKKACIKSLKENYKKDCVIMIGDAPGDMEAAIENKILFYPILPNKEIESWKRFNQNYCEKFKTKNYTQEIEKDMVERFLKVLQTKAPW